MARNKRYGKKFKGRDGKWKQYVYDDTGRNRGPNRGKSTRKLVNAQAPRGGGRGRRRRY